MSAGFFGSFVAGQFQRASELRESAFSEQRLQRGVGHLLRGVGTEQVGAAVDSMHGLAVGAVAGIDELEGLVGLAERVEDAGLVFCGNAEVHAGEDAGTNADPT
ncbi:MAG: hypothetical protein IPO90_15940 [Flavobacteriales bacterium]|nr:hypothetical protein [Flavobacteriales bacterium]